MGTDRKITAVARSRTAGATRSTPPRERPGDDAGATASADPSADAVTTVLRRFRRGRWTVTAVPA